MNDARFDTWTRRRLMLATGGLLAASPGAADHRHSYGKGQPPTFQEDVFTWQDALWQTTLRDRYLLSRQGVWLVLLVLPRWPNYDGVSARDHRGLRKFCVNVHVGCGLPRRVSLRHN